MKTLLSLIDICIYVIFILMLFFAFKYAVEFAYYEGQRDAINGDVRIEKNTYGEYHWIKTPWDGGINPLFKP